MSMQLTLRLGHAADLETVLELLHAPTVTPTLDEAVERTKIRDLLARNAEQGGCWLAELDGVPVGVGLCDSRRPYRHMLRHGLVGVLGEYRRRRIGTALYTAQIAQAVIEGRRLVEAAVLADNPHLPHLLPRLGYQEVGVLPDLTPAFRTVRLYYTTPHLILPSLLAPGMLPLNLRLTLATGDATDRTYAANIRTYEQHNPLVAGLMAHARTLVLTNPLFEVIRYEPESTHESAGAAAA